MDSIRPLDGEASLSLDDGCTATFRFGQDEALGRLEVISVVVTGVVTTDTLRSVPLGQVRGWARAQPRIQQVLRMGAEVAFSAVPPDLKLEVPAKRQRGDGFFQEVARIYKLLVAAGNPAPAAAIAEANDVPSTTVHGWVRTARERGLIEPARKGSPS